MAQDAPKTEPIQGPAPAKKAWYQTLSLGGYMQVRYNRLLETNDDLKCEQCDKSWGGTGGFFIRRMRLKISGNLHERVFFYFQPDFAISTTSTGLHFTQLRDAFVDIALDTKKEFRFRIGQSKVPFGFENLQSSQNRLPLDRNDAINSAVFNERDLGIFFYWAPEHIRERYAYLISSGLKGSGDYGVFGLGIYNGQTANKPELNNTPHVVARLSYPIAFKNTQILEPGIQAYTGSYILPAEIRSTNVKAVSDFTFIDKRAAASLVLYPQPIGVQLEYEFGRGPEFNTQTDSIEIQSLHGGYALISYMIKVNKHVIIPFFRTQMYEGGKKHELDARSYSVSEHELGFEWQPNKHFELTAMYTISERRFEDFVNQDNTQKGNLLRLQVQLNY